MVSGTTQSLDFTWFLEFFCRHYRRCRLPLPLCRRRRRRCHKSCRRRIVSITPSVIMILVNYDDEVVNAELHHKTDAYHAC